jgi:heterodisulfide reductase subunit A
MEERLGGNILNIYHLPDGVDPQASMREIIGEVEANENIEVMLSSTLKDIKGFVGNFTAFVDNNGQEKELTVGVVIVATGGKELKPEGYYLYGEDDRVITQLEFDKMLKEKGPDGESIVMIQCVGSREEGRPYCSRVCCTEAIKNALLVKEMKPDTKVYVLFRDIRTYGFREKLYREAREKGVIFLRYLDDDQPKVEQDGEKLKVEVYNPNLNANITLHPDLLVLSSAMIPYKENEELGPILKVPLTEHKYFLEAHAKIKPVDFAAAGIFMCGSAASPKSIDEAISQASGAASRAATIITKETLDTEGVPAMVDVERCSGCGICEANCDYEAIKVNPETGVAEVNEVLCMGCGACSAMCPSSATSLRQFEPVQILHMIDKALEV